MINFYIIVIFHCIANMVYITILAIKPEQKPSIFDDDANEMQKTTAAQKMDLVNSCLLISLGWLQICTMYQLRLVLKTIFENLAEKEAQKKRMLMYCFGFLMVFIQIACIAFFLVFIKLD